MNDILDVVKLMENEELFKCPVCGLKYKEKMWAEKCEEWCKAHPGSCNPEVVKHSVQ